jgi:UDP-N-acetylglucosamine acyltransferase
MAEIHPSAIVEPGAKLGEGVVVGPFSIVGSEVELGDNVSLVSHAVVTGRTKVGGHTRIYPFASIGHIPQDLKYQGESSELIIGEHCVIREYVTMNPGTKGGGLMTRVGNHCLFMIGAHVAHDCKVGDHVVMANNATLAGHVVLEDYVILGGLSAVHQFVRVGCHAMIGGMTGVENDVIPYGSVKGDRGRLSGLNIVGLRRRQFSREDIHALRNAYRLLFAEEGTMAERIKDVSELFSENVAVMDIVEFIRTDSSRAICQPKMEQAA